MRVSLRDRENLPGLVVPVIITGVQIADEGGLFHMEFRLMHEETGQVWVWKCEKGSLVEVVKDVSS